jgi:hypothetical protein
MGGVKHEFLENGSQIFFARETGQGIQIEIAEKILAFGAIGLYEPRSSVTELRQDGILGTRRPEPLFFPRSRRANQNQRVYHPQVVSILEWPD